MSFDLDTKKVEVTSEFSRRYEAIDEANKKSFYMNNPIRTFDIYQSVESYGDARVDVKSLGEFDPLPAVERIIAAGNMSTEGAPRKYGPAELTDLERVENAKENMDSFFESLDMPKTSVYLLFPERDYSSPLTVVDVDAVQTDETTTWPARLDDRGDLIYTRDPNKILAIRPADCPVMIATADTPDGKIYTMTHYAWKGAANHYVEQTARIFESFGIDNDSLEIYISPGAQAESYPYKSSNNPLEEYPGTEGLFTDIRSSVQEDGKTIWQFNIDTPKFVYDQVLEHLNVDSTQVFCDTSNTSAPESGYSSHGRSQRLKDQGESNTRDIVTAVFSK